MISLEKVYKEAIYYRAMYNSEYSTENAVIPSDVIPFFADEIKAQAFTLNVLNWTRGLLTEEKADVVVTISKGANDNCLTIDIEFAASALMTGVRQMQTLQERILKNLDELLSKDWEQKHKEGNNFSLFMHQRKLTLYEIIFLERVELINDSKVPSDSDLLGW